MTLDNTVKVHRNHSLLANMWSAAWSTHLLVSFLDPFDVATVALARLEHQGEADRHAEAIGGSSIQSSIREEECYWPTIPSRELLQRAVTNGCWHALLKLRGHHNYGRRQVAREIGNVSRTELAFQAIEKMQQTMRDADLRCPHAMVLARWQQEFFPLTYKSETICAAAGRGSLESVIWLDSVLEDPYTPREVAERAIGSSNMTIPRWLATRHSPQRSSPLSVASDCDDEHDSRASSAPRPGIPLFYARKNRGCYPRCAFWWQPEEMVLSAVKAGYIPILVELQAHGMIARKCGTYLIEAAAIRGHLEMVQWLHTHWPQTLTTGILWRTIHSKNFALMEWVLARMDNFDGGRLLWDVVAFNPPPHVLQWILQRCSNLQTALTGRNGTEIRTTALAHGNIEVVKILERVGLSFDTFECVTRAAKGGHHELVQWLLSRFDAISVVVDTDERRKLLVESAAQSGKLKLVRWLVESLGYWSPRAIVDAVCERRLSVIQYLVGISRKDPSRINQYASIYDDELSSTGCLGILEYVLEYIPELTICLHWTNGPVRYHTRFKPKELSTVYFRISRLGGVLRDKLGEVIQTFARLRPDQARSVSEFPEMVIRLHDKKAMRLLVQIDHPDLWTWETYDALVKYGRDEGFMKLFLSKAPEFADLRACKWASKHGFTELGVWIVKELFRGNAAVISREFVSAAENGTMEMMLACYTLGLPMEGKAGVQTWRTAICQAVIHDRRMALDWLLATTPSVVAFAKDTSVLVDAAARHGCLQCLWILMSAPYDFKGSLHGLVQAVQHGHVPTALFLCAHQPDLVNSSARGRDLLAQARTMNKRLHRLQ